MLNVKLDPKAVFCDALEEGTPEKAAAYVDEVCAGDEELRERVKALIRADQEAGRFLG